MNPTAATQPQHTDAQYVEALRTGDNTLIGELYDRCRRELMLHLKSSSHIEADDRRELLQAAFLQLWQLATDGRLYTRDGNACLATRHDGEKPVNSLVAYFLGIAANQCRCETRFRARFEPLGIEPSDEPDENEEQTKQRIVARCLLALPHRCREILTLFYYEHRSLDDILALRTAAKGETLSYDGLKTAKSKCMKQLMNNIKQACRQEKLPFNTRPRTKR